MVGGPPLIVKLLEGTQGKGVVLAEKKRRKVLSMLSKA
jgi:ribosomal protein S6--L-glutamate ligase